jgi:adhesin HecA-like repeat protein
VTAANVTNSGEIDAQSGPLAIDTGTLTDFGLTTGSGYLSQKCGRRCVSDGTAGLTEVGGAINAAGSMQIDASTEILNQGGLITSYGNMDLNSPRVVANAMFLPSVATFPWGLYDGFKGSMAFVVGQPVGGAFLAPNGSITVAAGVPVSIDGGALIAADGVFAPSGTTTVSPALPKSGLRGLRIGIFRWLW